MIKKKRITKSLSLFMAMALCVGNIRSRGDKS